MPVLRLALALPDGKFFYVFETENLEWEELSRRKDVLKSRLPVRWNRDAKAWVFVGDLGEEEVGVISEVFEEDKEHVRHVAGLYREKMKKAFEARGLIVVFRQGIPYSARKYSIIVDSLRIIPNIREIVKNVGDVKGALELLRSVFNGEDAIYDKEFWEKHIEKIVRVGIEARRREVFRGVKGTFKVLRTGWIDGELYRLLRGISRVEGKFFVVDPSKIPLFASREEYVEYLRGIADRLEKSGSVVFDKEFWLGEGVDVVMKAHEGLREVVVEEVDEDGRLFVVFRFNARIPSKILDWVNKNGYYEMYIETYNEYSGLERRLIKRLTAFIKGNEIKAYPYLFWDLRNFLEKNGFRVHANISFESRDVSLKSVLNLRDYQAEAVEEWEKSGRRGTVVLPTGSGKTFVGLEAIRRVGRSFLVLVPTVELARQWVEKIEKYLGVRAGLLGGGRREYSLPFLVATYNSATNYAREIARRFDLVIFDEGHHVPASTFKSVALNMYAPYRLVLTATPKREDKNEILLFRLCGNIVYEKSFDELARRGYVAPIEIIEIPVEFDQRAREKYLEVEEKIREEKLFRKPSPRLLNQRRRIALENPAKDRVVAEIVVSNLGKKMLVFSQYVSQAKRIYSVLKKAGVRAGLVIGETPEGERRRVVEGFKRGEIQVIVSTVVLDEGFDVPDAELVVIASSTKQPRQLIQRIGRITRPSEGKRGEVYMLYTVGSIEERDHEEKISFLSKYFPVRKKCVVGTIVLNS